MPCTFCDERHDAVYADERCFVMLHDDWAVRGHAMVVWRKHVENLSDLADDDVAHLMSVFVRTERALLALTGADRAVALKLGIATPHLHLHIYPVGAELDRAAVQAIIDARTREIASAEERTNFAEEVRQLLAE
jgi:diadenosine tetraphosphate (Ap4A) HIT family hydrolase